MQVAYEKSQVYLLILLSRGKRNRENAGARKFGNLKNKRRRQKRYISATAFPGSFLSREKDPGWVWSRATQILGGSK